MTDRTGEARHDGEPADSLAIDVTVGELLAVLTGPRILGVHSPEEATPTRQLAQLDGFLARIRHGFRSRTATFERARAGKRTHPRTRTLASR